jgi:hypothetical protein
MISYKKIRGIPVILVFPLFSFSQYSDGSIVLLKKLDSASKAPSISRHFATLYLETTQLALDYFSAADKPVQEFMQRLEQRFADYFFTAAEAFENKQPLPAEWNNYYADTNLTRLQYFLLGANAHINGDIWKALTTEFSLEDIRENKRYYFKYERKLASVYRDMYRVAKDSVIKLKWLHTITLGLDREYGRWMLAKWRKRQMRMAILYYTNKRRFEKKGGGVKDKMNTLDRLIVRSL